MGTKDHSGYRDLAFIWTLNHYNACILTLVRYKKARREFYIHALQHAQKHQAV